MRRTIVPLTSALLLAAACAPSAPLTGAGASEPSSSGRAYDVRILRDTWGIPHVFGKTDADVAYGLAYAHAEDDFATIQDSLLAARGRLASVYGRKAAANDYMVHLFRVWDVVEEKVQTELSPEMRAVCEAYAEGINHYGSLHPRELRRGILPIRCKDVVAGFVHKVPLFFRVDRTLRELMGPERQLEVSERADARPIPGDATPQPGTGSNAFAVAPSRSADGKTRLSSNSHQPWEGPVAWYEVHVHSEEGWDMYGGLFPGSPVVFNGYNRNLSWTSTNNHPDLVDVYVLEINPENPDQYRFDGEWRELEVRTAQIEVKLWGPISWTFDREVLWSVHGPVLRRPHGTYAIRYAGIGEVRMMEQWYRMDKARSFQEWLDALRLMALPMFNFTYADGQGNIYYVYNALLPVRAEGYDWSRYLPGDTSETLWTRYLPFERLPQIENPASGFLQNCNSTPYQTTIGPENPKPEDYSPTLGIGGGPDILHAVYGDDLEDGRVTGRRGDSFVLFVTWDENGPTARAVSPYGTAIQDESSPHYADQSPFFVKRQTRPTWFQEAEIRAHLEREYRPGEER